MTVETERQITPDPGAAANLNLPGTPAERVGQRVKLWHLECLLDCRGAAPAALLDEAIRRLEQVHRILGPPEHWDYFNELLEWTWCLADDISTGHLHCQAHSKAAEYTLKRFLAWATAWQNAWEQTPWDKNSEEPE